MRGFGRRDWLALLLLAGLSFGFHGRHLVSGRVRMGDDLAWLQEPLRAMYVTALRQGQLALWWPRLNLGTPVFAESQMGQLHPVNLLFFSLLPARVGSAVWTVALSFLVGAFTYLFAREIGLSYRGRLLSALAFMFSGFFLAHVNHTYAFLLQAAHLPLAMLLAERMATSGSGGRGRWGPWWAALVFALAVLAGHFQLTFQAVLLYLFYGGWRAMQEGGTWRGRGGRVVWLIAPLLAAAGLSAVQWMPTRELFTLYPPDRRAWGPMHPFQLAAYVSPYVLAEQNGYWDVWWTGLSTNFWETLAYMGIVPLGMVGLAWGGRQRERRVWPLAAGAVLFTLLSMGQWVPTYYLVEELPGFSYFRAPGRYIFGAAFCLAALAGIGLESILSTPRGEVDRRLTARRLKAFVLVLAVGTVGALVLGVGAYLAVAGTPGSWPPSSWWRGGLRELLGRWAIGLPVVAVSAAAFWWVLRRGRGAAALAVAVTVADLILVGLTCERFRLHSATLRELAEPGPVLRHLPPPESAGRVYCHNFSWPLNVDYDLLLLVSGNVPKAQVWLATLPLKEFWRVWPTLRMFGVEFIATNRPILGDDRLTLLVSGPDPQVKATHGRAAAKEVYLYRCPDAVPRALLVDEALANLDPWHQDDQVEGARFDPLRKVVLDGVVTPDKVGRPMDDFPGTCRIVESGLTRVRIEVEAVRSAWLVLNDLYYPGWRAWVGRRQTPIYLANRTVRAVYVPAGHHTVTFEYRPRSLAVGLLVSGATAAVWAASAMVWWMLRRRAVRSKVTSLSDS
jgi:hypothetical protein